MPGNTQRKVIGLVCCMSTLLLTFHGFVSFRRDPTAYVETTRNRWIDLHGGKTSRRRFNLRLTLSELVDEYAEAAEQDPDGHRLYFILHPDSTAYIVAGPALELLDREHGRLPAIFYHVFTGALNKWVRIYEYRDAEDRVEMLREWAVRTGNVRALPANRGSR